MPQAALFPFYFKGEKNTSAKGKEEMTPEELKEVIETSDQFAAEHNLGQCDGVSLVMMTNRPPTGYKIRTPFGNCDIMNCQEKLGRYQTVFRVSRKQALAYLKKCNIALEKKK